MAQGSNEHRMVFDIRGRRRHVVKVVYAILAILMAASLFLVTGAINIGSILGTSSSGESAASEPRKAGRRDRSEAGQNARRRRPAART